MKLGPAGFVDNTMNSRFRNPELARNSQQFPALFPESANSGNSLEIHWHCLESAAILGCGIMHIVSVSSKEQMLGIYATSVVARMADEKTVWDWPNKKLIGYSVSTAVTELTVPFHNQTALPLPAAILQHFHFSEQPFLFGREVQSPNPSQAEIMELANTISIEWVRAALSVASFHGGNTKSKLRQCQELLVAKAEAK